MTDEVPEGEKLVAAIRADPAFKDAIGERVDGAPAEELDHFYLCKACGQPVDRRDLGAVFHHEDRGHQPLPTEDAERLLRISEQLKAALQR